MIDYTPLLQELNLSLDKVGRLEKAALSEDMEISSNILKSLREGDHSAYATVFNAYHEPVRKFLAVMIRNEEDAQELTQDVFARLWEKHEIIDPKKNIKGFLYKTAKFFMLSYFKHKKVILRYHDFTTSNPEYGTSTDDIIIAKELSILAEIAISRMPKRQQQVYKLRFHEQKTNEEIASLMNVTLETVRGYFKEGNQELRKVFVAFITLFMLQ